MQTKNLSNTKTLIALLTTVFLWASSFVAIRAGLTGYDPGSLALLRYSIASVCMVFLFLRITHRSKLTLKEWASVFILGLIGFAIYNVTLNYGEVTVTSGIASFIVSQIPTGIVILATLFLKERLSINGWLGIVISVTGVTLIAFSAHGDSAFHLNFSVIFLIIATLCGAFYSVYHKPLLRKLNPIELISYAIWSGTFCMLIYAPALVHELKAAPLSATLAAIYLGIFPAAIGYLSWGYVLAHMPASKAGSYLYLMPVIATVLGWLLLNEKPTLISLIGGFIALAGAIIVNRQRSHKPANKSDINNQ